MKKLYKLYLIILGLPKTILFNFWYLPFNQAIKLPIFVSHRVWLMKLSGNVKITNTGTGAVQIGFGSVGIFDQKTSRSIWQVTGQVEFNGVSRIGHGSKICVSGKLVLGSGFTITAESSIIARCGILIGDNVLLSWDVLIMDTDIHKIYDQNDKEINTPKQIVIGSNVWIGCRSMILKGVHIADGVVVGAASNVLKSVEIKNAIIAGSPAKVIKENITWEI